MAENQNPISFRADEETKAKFTKICEQFDSKGAALQALIVAFETDEAKKELPGCADQIDKFHAYLNAISRAYFEQLDMNASTEERFRLKFEAEIDSLNKALQASQQQAQTAQETAEKAQAALDAVKEQAEQEQQQAIAQVAAANDRADRAEQARQVAEQAASDARRTADAVAARVNELTAERDRLRADAERADSLNAELAQAQAEITRLTTAAEVAAADARAAQAQAVADAERSMQGKLDMLREKFDSEKDELSKIKDTLHQTQAERDSFKSQLDMIQKEQKA